MTGVASWVRGLEPLAPISCQLRTLLTRLRRSQRVRFGFVADDHDVSHLPSWAKSAKQTTDGHLAQLAVANDAVLATLDERIPAHL
jgi:hypothetical protein